MGRSDLRKTLEENWGKYTIAGVASGLTGFMVCMDGFFYCQQVGIFFIFFTILMATFWKAGTNPASSNVQLSMVGVATASLIIYFCVAGSYNLSGPGVDTIINNQNWTISFFIIFFLGGLFITHTFKPNMQAPVKAFIIVGSILAFTTCIS